MNKIKSITTYVAGDQEGEKILTVYEDRDQLGNIVLLKHFNEDGDLENKTDYEFDEKGRVIVEEQYSTGKSPDQVIRIEYNESGKAHQVTLEFADGSVSYKKYSRDEAEKSTTIDIVDQDGEVEGKEFRRFDGEDRVLKEVIYSDSGEVETKAEFEYNDYGEITESVRVDEEGFETVRFYDYHRDDKARVYKVDTLNEDEKIIRTDEFEFDERGNRAKHIMKDLESGSVFTDLREFDQNDNEVRFERMMGERPIELIETKFTIDGLMEKQEMTKTEGPITYLFEYELY
ncbi:MAG: hypothetical protein ACI8P3_001209 [Saprospiraceae bacterium]|jgi:hypothetical protein